MPSENEDQIEPQLDTPQEQDQGQPPTAEPVPGSSQPTGRTSGYTPEYVSLLEQQLREQNRQIQELINAQTTAATTAQPLPSRDVDAEKARFYTDPMDATRSVVREELQATVRPLLDFVKEMKSGNAYTDLKSRYRLDPRFTSYFVEPGFEATVDQIMSKAEKNETNMQAAIVHAIGLKAMGALPIAAVVPNGQPQPQPQPVTTGASVPQPPHMRPSGSQLPTNSGVPKRRALNELEKRMARERWPNDPDAENKYLNFLELPADQVIVAGKDGKIAVKK